MGQVIPITAVHVEPAVSRDPVEQSVSVCYDMLQADSSFRSRPGQRQLSVDIAKALIARVPIAAEAPTGTGKTIAYLVGALVAAKYVQPDKSMTIVVATATVGLQQQIMQGDLPRFYKAGLLDSKNTLLAKGRSRYFCVANAERQVSSGDNLQVDFFDAKATEAAEATGDIQKMLDNWYSRSWDGDFDSWKGTLSDYSDRVRASSDTCINKKCEHYSSCPFFNARRMLSGATLVVANHDLVLSDLMMVLSDQEPLFPTKQYIVAFDEAHHLPDKALEMGAKALHLEQARLELPKFNALANMWTKTHELNKKLKRAKIDTSGFDPGPALNTIAGLKSIAEQIPVDAQSHNFRFPEGKMPDGLLNMLKAALSSYYVLYDTLNDTNKVLKKGEDAGAPTEVRNASNEILFLGAALNRHVKESMQALEGLIKPGSKGVKWLHNREGSMSLHSSPLEGGNVLKELLWSSTRAIPAMVSATLQDFDGFDRYKDKLGVGEELRTTQLPHIFPYEESTLGVVMMDYSPKFDERAHFEKELQTVLPRFVDETEGTLILLPSRRLHRILVPVLKSLYPGKVLAQGDMGIKELVALHKERIDAKQGSILCGLATMAEGLDLPGDYCTHVMICALPFVVPTNPVEQELQEKMGRDYFEKKALPDTLVKLVQMVGRLMRRETDRGKITFFDKRLVRTRWGQKLLDALPNFKRRTYAPDMPPLKRVA